MAVCVCMMCGYIEHVLLSLQANLLDAMGGWIAAVYVGSGSQPQSSQPVSPVAEGLLSLLYTARVCVGEHVASA